MLSKLQRIANMFKVIFYSILFLLPLLIFMEWFLPNLMLSKWLANIGMMDRYNGYYYLRPEHRGTFSFMETCLGFMGTFISFLPFLISLMILIRIFKNYSHSKIFSIENTNFYRWLGYLFLIDGIVAKPISDILLSLAISLGTKQTMFEIRIELINLESIFCGILFLIIANVMKIGYQNEKPQLHNSHS